MGELPQPAEITGLLTKWREGDDQARDALFAAVYLQLRQIAARFLQRERRDHTLEPGAVVNELYLRVFGGQPIAYKDRAHFFAVAAETMRAPELPTSEAVNNGGCPSRMT
jgi:ECF sigma factor